MTHNLGLEFLRQMRGFSPANGLQYYLAKRQSKLITLAVTTYRLSTILLALKEIIQEESLFDPDNRTIIILNYDLERIFQTKVIHASQMRKKLEALLIPRFGKEVTYSLDIANKEIEAMNFWIACEQIPIEKSPISDVSEKISIRTELFHFLKNHGILPRKAGRRMPFDKFGQKLARYFLKLRDPRNNYILDVTKHYLGHLLNKNYLTEAQAFAIIEEKFIDKIPPKIRKTLRTKKLP